MSDKYLNGVIPDGTLADTRESEFDAAVLAWEEAQAGADRLRASGDEDGAEALLAEAGDAYEWACTVNIRRVSRMVLDPSPTEREKV